MWPLRRASISRVRQTSNIAIPFARSEWADIVRTTLEVDKELKPTIVRRTLEAKDGVLHVYVHSHFLRHTLALSHRVACCVLRAGPTRRWRCGCYERW
jgi:hypothetical protein